MRINAKGADPQPPKGGFFFNRKERKGREG